MNKEYLNPSAIEKILADEVVYHVACAKNKDLKKTNKVERLYNRYTNHIQTMKNPNLNLFRKVDYSYREHMELNTLKESFEGYK